ncbi:hypothetical protein EIP91_006955 [Steccherinum ochraceum]|uniref:DUF7918 domain-containing protein n=1 Tax=Steccherinum ochraceum TaxID=92696 RepID=A0A4R0R7H1_9APHY|nr:hypothetical protein EIP91_006955 [Steccherinum ochraceum]
MVTFKDCGVFIVRSDNGTAFEEYKPVMDGHRVTCCIASELGQDFDILLRNSESCAVTMWVYVDGVRTYKRTMSSGQECRNSGVRISDEAVRQYRFAEVSVTEVSPDTDPSDEIGSIRVVLRRCYITGNIPRPVFPELNLELGTHSLGERSKKDGLHRTNLGNAVAQARLKTMTVKQYIDTEDQPFGIVTILYRPRAVLQAQGFLSSPSESKHRPDSPPLPVPSAESSRSRKRTPEPGGAASESLSANKRARPTKASSLVVKQEAAVGNVNVKQELLFDSDVEDVEMSEAKKRLEQEQKELVLQQQQLVAMQQSQVALLRERVESMERRRRSRESKARGENHLVPSASSSREIIDLTVDD